jgi:hypothetical protein
VVAAAVAVAAVAEEVVAAAAVVEAAAAVVEAAAAMAAVAAVAAAAAVVLAAVEAAAAAVLAGVPMGGKWDAAVPTLQEWGTALARVRPAAAALDSATRVLGIRGTTLCQH